MPQEAKNHVLELKELEYLSEFCDTQGSNSLAVGTPTLTN